MKLIDPNHPFFAPIWRRWLVSAVPLAWGGFELVTGNLGWAILFGGAGLYALYELILKAPSDS